ncbi:MAG TPA: acyl-ACP thioesterase domain-containing protein [Solirubrobacteraceae bacterium]|nr:acyl-ACP thioesterase domain-containing protein [Solirubrobacteraceae bacterium]
MPPGELVAPPAGGRVFRHPAAARLADVTPSGRARLDAIARWLQDAALADVVDSGLDGGGVWVLRRLRLCVERFPRFGDAVEVETFCSGTGPLVAERRSTVRDGAGAAVQALALWVHLDPDGAHPRPLPDGFETVYGAAAAGRRVRARLRHPAAPPANAPVRPWRFRAADLDLAGHVNNAVYWQVLEEELVADAPAALDAEIEHRAAADAGDAVVAAADGMRWVSAGEQVVATIRLAN